MLINTLQSLYERELNKLYYEIDSYTNENRIWHFEKNINNSAGNLCLHLAGNLNTYIGAQLGNTNYIRDRAKEFSLKNIPASELLKMIDNTKLIVKTSLENLSPEDLQKEYPLLVFEHPVSAEYLLIHLTIHLGYHIGQINYHRRLLDN